MPSGGELVEDVWLIGFERLDMGCNGLKASVEVGLEMM